MIVHLLCVLNVSERIRPIPDNHTGNGIAVDYALFAWGIYVLGCRSR